MSFVDQLDYYLLIGWVANHKLGFIGKTDLKGSQFEPFFRMKKELKLIRFMIKSQSITQSFY